MQSVITNATDIQSGDQATDLGQHFVIANKYQTCVILLARTNHLTKDLSVLCHYLNLKCISGA